MKRISILSTVLLFSVQAYGDVQSCFKDANTNGNHQHAVAPEKECLELLRTHSGRKEAHSPSGKIKAVGDQNMFYVTVADSTVLMAGDQTLLEKIRFLRVDDQSGKLFVYQTSEGRGTLATYRSDFVGNVAPVSFVSSKDLLGLTNVTPLEKKNELALVYRTQKKISFMNILGDSRYQGEKFSPEIKRTLAGDETKLSAPTAVTYSDVLKELFVLDSERILVFQDGSDKPKKTYRAPGSQNVTQMLLREAEKKLFLYGSTGEVISFIDLK